MSSEGSEKRSDAPQDPRNNQGLANELNAMIEHEHYSEGSAVVDASPEHAEAVEDLLDTREQQQLDREAERNLRLRALEELAGPSGVMTASQEEVTAKMQEIAARDAGESQQSAA